MIEAELPYAEDCPYWKSGRSGPDKWVDKSVQQIEQFGGEVLSHAFGSESRTGRAAFMISFEMEGESFRITWPVLPSKSGDASSANRQAATALYHDVKAKINAAYVLGARSAFFNSLVLPNGRVLSTLGNPQLTRLLPKLLGEIEDETKAQ